jgi:hypothetical protein
MHRLSSWQTHQRWDGQGRVRRQAVRRLRVPGGGEDGRRLGLRRERRADRGPGVLQIRMMPGVPMVWSAKRLNWSTLTRAHAPRHRSASWRARWGSPPVPARSSRWRAGPTPSTAGPRRRTATARRTSAPTTCSPTARCLAMPMAVKRTPPFDCCQRATRSVPWIAKLATPSWAMRSKWSVLRALRRAPTPQSAPQSPASSWQ